MCQTLGEDWGWSVEGVETVLCFCSVDLHSPLILIQVTKIYRDNVREAHDMMEN